MINFSVIHDFCLSLKGVYEDFPFDDEILTFKVGGKIFLLTSLKKWEEKIPFINIKCSPDKAIELRQNYDFIKPAYHMNKTHWNGIYLNECTESNSFVLNQILNSYNLIFDKLPKKEQQRVLEKFM